MPGVLNDPYRAIEVQPGVTPTASGFPYYFIRGAPPGNIGYFFDGIQVPLLFHVGGGPSVIPSQLVQRVELHPGPYPAEVGRFAGAIIEAERAPAPLQWRGEAGLRVGDIGGFVEGPLGENVSVLAGGRYSIGAAIVSLIVPSIAVQYGDYQAGAVWKLGSGHRLSVLAFGAYDYLATVAGEGDAETRDVLLDSDFHRVDLRYDRESPSGGTVRAAVTLGLDQSRSVGVERARDLKLAARAAITRPVGDGRALLRGGVDVAVDGYSIIPQKPPCPAGGGSLGPGGGPTPDGECDPSLPAPEPGDNRLDITFRELFPSRVDLAFGAWADARIALDERSSITPGIRVDHYRSLGATATAVDPKIVGRFGIGPHLSLIPAVGLASQLPGFAPLPALQIGGIPGGLQRNFQTSFGAEMRYGPIELVTSIFRHATFNLTDPIGTNRGTDLDAERFLSRSLGDAYGLEIGARGALRRDLLFVVSYTLSRSTRKSGGITVPSSFDRTHVAHVALLYDLGRNWRAGVRHVIYTGFPAEEVGPGFIASEDPDRVRPFYRFDFRVSKRWKVGERGFVALIADVQNATLSKEVFDVACDSGGCTPQTLGPVTIPGLALEAGF
jgi:hypothetical protein